MINCLNYLSILKVIDDNYNMLTFLLKEYYEYTIYGDTKVQVMII